MIFALLQIVVAAATLQGRVVEWGTTTPLAQVEVELRPIDNSTAKPLVVVTSAQGEYRFSNVPPGRYRLLAMRAGFTQAEYRQRRPNGAGMPITVLRGQQLTGVMLAMAPGAAISGRLTDRNGQPIQRANVYASRLSYADGRPTLTTVQNAITDDRGEYRMFWLSPGQYYVNFWPICCRSSIIVNPSAPDAGGATFALVSTRPLRPGPVPLPSTLNEREVYLPTYFPGTIELKSAVLLNLRAGEEVRDVNVTSLIRNSVRLKVTMVEATPGTAPFALALFLTPLAPPSTSQSAQSVGGVATFEGLAPGLYEIRATRQAEVAGRAVVEILDRDLDVTLPLAVFTLSGHVHFENAAAGFDPQQQQLTLRADPAFRAKGSLAANGTFSIAGVPSGDYELAFSDAVLRDTYVKSIRMGQHDVLGEGLRIAGQPVDSLEIVLSGNGGELTGSVVNNRQQPVAESMVVLVPNVPASPRRLDLYKTASTDADGKFHIQGIAPGEYSVYAWEDVDPGAWLDPNFVNLFRSLATTIHISEGQRLSTNVISIP